MEVGGGCYALVDVLAVGQKDVISGPGPEAPDEGEGCVEEVGEKDEDTGDEAQGGP